MKATKKIVGATAALVAALALSAGSTFAWFSANTSVSATGMDVTVTVPTNLYIATGVQTDPDLITESTVNLNHGGLKLQPARITPDEVTDTVLNVEFAQTFEPGQEPTITSPGTPAADGMVQVGTITVNANSPSTNEPGYEVSNYASYNQISVVRKADTDTEQYGLNASVTISGITGDTSYKYLKVGFLNGNTWTVKGIDGEATGTATIQFDDLVTGINDNTPVNFNFVIWFDGDDKDCYSNNAVNVATLSVSISFTDASI